MDKATVLSEIGGKHDEMEALLASLDERQMTQRGVYEELSVKDVLVHIVAWERMMLGWLAAIQRGESPVRYAPGFIFNEQGPDEDPEAEAVMNRLNDHVFQENKNRPLADVMADFQATHEDVVKAVSQASDADLFDEKHSTWRRKWAFYETVAGNTYGHYQEHIDLIRAWLNDGKHG